MFTWKQLAAHIAAMTPEQQEMKVVGFDMNNDESCSIDGIAVYGEEDEQDCCPDQDDPMINFGMPYLYTVP